LRIAVPIALTIGFSLGCSLVGGDKAADSGSSPGDTSASASEPGHQTGSCRDYLACAAEVDEKNYDKRKDQYGEEGDCWDTKESQYACDDDCEEWLEELQDENPREPACADGSGDDTDDTDRDTGGGGGGTDCALQEGWWTFDFFLELDECLDGGNELWVEAEVANCDGGSFELEMGDLLPGYPLACTSSGRDFSCWLDSAVVAVASGYASADGESADDVNFQIIEPCQMYGYGIGELR
jgi:hypothetical protein